MGETNEKGMERRQMERRQTKAELATVIDRLDQFVRSESWRAQGAGSREPLNQMAEFSG